MAKDKKSEEKKEESSLAKMSESATKNFLQKVQEQYVEKYAKDMVQILDDQKKLRKALDRVNKAVTEVEAGDFTAIDRYKKARHRLEIEDNAELE